MKETAPGTFGDAEDSRPLVFKMSVHLARLVAKTQVSRPVSYAKMHAEFRHR